MTAAWDGSTALSQSAPFHITLQPGQPTLLSCQELPSSVDGDQPGTVSRVGARRCMSYQTEALAWSSQAWPCLQVTLHLLQGGGLPGPVLWSWSGTSQLHEHYNAGGASAHAEGQLNAGQQLGTWDTISRLPDIVQRTASARGSGT